ncbi:MFS transporter [Micromonospora polyrhachis]|uniref:Putative MFS family arabinose efflux permease n=1 Tax=Micromonospora polyrhachis TaxID=1282883 RepID=A0A7W7SWY5_9ACTN|nr:MFS transporter [Micromonospora polyrhachis]MBB4962469.1 putative MFS family arabinose efflux permease [Micromonospora polyrhachis]
MSLRVTVGRTVAGSPYWPVLRHPLLRRVLPGIGLSSLGNGMSTVAISWLALELAPAGQRGLWVALAVAAYTLPGAAGALLFGRLLSGRSGAQLAGWDATLRAGTLAAIPLAHLLGALTVGWYVVLLGVSSLLHAWGTAGRYTMLTELLPQRHLLAGNAVVNMMLEFTTVVGPPMAALLIGGSGAVWVIAVDAATFAVLAVTYRYALPRASAAQPKSSASRTAGLRVIRRDPRLLGLLALSFGWFFLYGPVTVALPVYAVEELGGTPATLAAFYTAFGIGAVVGAFAAGYLRTWPLLPTSIGIVLCFGVALVPLGLGVPTTVAWAAFALCGLIWGPFPSTTITLFQQSTDAQNLPRVLAARGAVTVISVPLGAVLGAPALVVLGARGTLLASAVSIVVVGILAAGFFALRRTVTTRRSSAVATDHTGR